MMGDFLKYKQFEKTMILLCVRWYFRYPLSYRHLVEMMDERGISIAHTTIMRWVHKAGPLLDHLVKGVPIAKEQKTTLRI